MIKTILARKKAGEAGDCNCEIDLLRRRLLFKSLESTY